MLGRSFVVVALLAFAAPAHGQSAAILAKDNAAFARELYRRGYADLAEGLCATIEKAPDVASDELAQVKVLALDFKLESAKRETDPVKKKDLVLAVVAGKQDFLNANPTGAEAAVVRESLPETLRVLGESLLVVMKTETDPNKYIELREQGNVQFQEAEKQLETLTSELATKRDDPAIDLRYMQAAYDLCKVQFFHAQLTSTDKEPDAKRYNKALEAFQRFGLDYSDQLVCIEGMIFQGLIHKALGMKDDALLDFDDAIRLRENFEQDSNGKYNVAPEAADVISKAYMQKARMLAEQGNHKDAIATSQDYFATVNDALQASQALALLSAELDSRMASGDSAGASEVAQKIADADPTGPWGARAHEMLGKTVTSAGAANGLGADKLLQVAESLMEKGEFDKALSVCSQALEAARGGANEADWGCEAMISMGVILRKKGESSVFDACAAFDSAAERFPTAKRAPDAIAASMDGYQSMYAKDKLSFYKKRFDDRLGLLISKYPTHPAAAASQLYEAKGFEKEEAFDQAAAAYLKVLPDAPAYAEAQYKAGYCLFRHAVKTSKANKAADVKSIVASAEAQLKKSVGIVQTATTKTLDRDMLGRLEKYSFEIPVSLANLYLFAGGGQEAKVIEALAGLEDKYGADEQKVSTVWGLRIQALRALGKLDEAEKLLQALIAKSPDSKAIGTAAGVLARALDQRAIEVNEKTPDEASGLWKRSMRYYVIGVKARQKAGGRGDDTEQIAQRLYAMGLSANHLPDTQISFVGWRPEKPEAVDREYWKNAAELYEIAQATSASYRTLIGLARCYGFLGQWDQASGAYGRLFDQERLVDPKTKKFDRAVITAKPELIFAYLESGVTEYEVGKSMKDSDKLNRATQIFNDILATYDNTSEMWWHAKYHQLRALFERGDYDTADVALRGVERTTQDFDEGKYGYKKLFTELKAELAKKVFKK